MLRKTKLLCLIAFASISLPLSAEGDEVDYDYRERTRQLAFDPAQFFPDRYVSNLFMSIRYTGDDYGYPVYSIGVRKGCTREDKGDARKLCANRLIARMVRSPFQGEPERPRWRGQKLFGALHQKKVADDAGLKRALDEYGLEWLEADVNACAFAIAHLETASELKFFTTSPLPADGEAIAIVLHADKIEFRFGEYLERVRYEGMLKTGNPGSWADGFAKSLATCWKPATARSPWNLAE